MQCHRKVVSGRNVASAIKPLINDRNLQPRCAVLHEILLVPICMVVNQ